VQDHEGKAVPVHILDFYPEESRLTRRFGLALSAVDCVPKTEQRSQLLDFISFSAFAFEEIKRIATRE
jgi:hypothetical protein